MKTLKFLLLALFATTIIFTSCEKEEDEALKAEIIGTWNLHSAKIATHSFDANTLKATAGLSTCKLVFNDGGEGSVKVVKDSTMLIPSKFEFEEETLWDVKDSIVQVTLKKLPKILKKNLIEMRKEGDMLVSNLTLTLKNPMNPLGPPKPTKIELKFKK